MLELAGDIITDGQFAVTVHGDRNVAFALLQDTKKTFSEALRLGTDELFAMLDFPCDDGTNLTDAMMPFILMKKHALLRGQSKHAMMQETSPGRFKRVTEWYDARGPQFLICCYLQLKEIIDADTTSN